MALDIQRYQYVPSYVEAVCVTFDAMKEIAEWCGGEPKMTGEGKHFVEVPVLRPNNIREKQAFIGQWVVKTERHGFKVYHGAAFRKFFLPTEIMSDEVYEQMVKDNAI